MTESRRAAGKSPERRARAPKFSEAAVLISRSTVAVAEPRLRTVAVQRALPAYTYDRKPPDRAYLPIQAAVDRHLPMRQMIVDIEIRDPETGEVLEVLHLPLFGRYGQGYPSDPGVFPMPASWAIALCPTLAPYAASRCGLW